MSLPTIKVFCGTKKVVALPWPGAADDNFGNYDATRFLCAATGVDWRTDDADPKAVVSVDGLTLTVTFAGDDTVDVPATQYKYQVLVLDGTEWIDVADVGLLVVLDTVAALTPPAP